MNCMSTRRPTTRLKEKEKPAEKGQVEKWKSKCISICDGNLGGQACSKIVLIDIYTQDNTQNVHRA